MGDMERASCPIRGDIMTELKEATCDEIPKRKDDDLY